MSKTLIRNIGCLLSGDIHEPILSADSVLIEDGVIQEIGTGLTAEDAVVYDAHALSHRQPRSRFHRRVGAAPEHDAVSGRLRRLRHHRHHFRR